MEIRIRLEKDEDGVWIATCPSLPGCISQGATQQDAPQNIKKAIKLHIRLLAEDGLPIFSHKGIKETLVEVHV
ncbi:MAG: type II toxin-antitoxin system HicB family antitoxin [Candidatus Omnitrophota bacterium]|nr:type II toxin-antitoxin system HicB family antitoxin [Candidatus Omnitrophota bacterium]